MVRLNISHLFYSLLTSDWSAVINPTLRLVVFSLDSNIFCCRESQVHLTSSGHVSAVAPVIATCPHTHLQAVSLHWFLVRLLGQNSRRHFKFEKELVKDKDITIAAQLSVDALSGNIYFCDLIYIMRRHSQKIASKKIIMCLKNEIIYSTFKKKLFH